MSDQSRLEDSLEKLQVAIDASKIELDPALVEGASLRVENIDDYVNQFLYASTKEVLKNKVTNTIDHNYQVRFLGITAPTIKVFEASQKLAKIVNEYTRAFQTVGMLGGFIQFDLYNQTKIEPQSCYLAYIAFTPEATKIIDQLMKAKIKSPFFQEGGVPPGEVVE